MRYLKILCFNIKLFFTKKKFINKNTKPGNILKNKKNLIYFIMLKKYFF
jgi:hypothetical protein